MNWEEMIPRERDALVAEKVMGWTQQPPSQCWYLADGALACGKTPWFSTHPVDARVAESEIERRGLRERYVYELAEILFPDGVVSIYPSAIEVNTNHGANGDDVVWAFVRATPEQRCRAALKTVSHA